MVRAVVAARAPPSPAHSKFFKQIPLPQMAREANAGECGSAIVPWEAGVVYTEYLGGGSASRVIPDLRLMCSTNVGTAIVLCKCGLDIVQV